MKKRGFGVGRWNGVGGKVKQNETIEQALVRECQEEIGVTPLDYNKVALIRFHEFSGNQKSDMEVHVYFCSRWQNEPAESEEMAPRWFETSQLPFDDMWPDDLYWLPKVLAGQKLTAEFHLDKDDKIIKHKLTKSKLN